MTSRASRPWAASTPGTAASGAWDDTNPDNAFAADPAVFESSSSSGSRKRKPPGSITPNACTSCKKARAKAVKEKLMSEIHGLREENQQLVQENLHLRQSNDSLEEILRSLKDDQRGQEILHLLKLGKDHQCIAAWLSAPHLSLDLKGPHMFPSSLHPLVETVGSHRQHSVIDPQAQLSWADMSGMYNVLFLSEQSASPAQVHPAVQHTM
ncbi:MAG: hypothetical protein L6R37_004126 [Teloschistes peruensis]|nr:MAG: hypothetical protein L6R37_004126 [Teloschistes peruensis]